MPGGTRAGETTTYCLLAMLASNGVTVLNEDGVALDSDATVEALRFIRGLVETGLLPNEVVGFEWDRSIRRLARGRAAMSIGGSYESRALADASGVAIHELNDIYGFAAMPAGPRGKIASSLANLARSTSKIPTRRSAIELVKEENPFVARTATILERAFMRPETEMYHHVSLQLQIMLEHVITSQLTPAAAANRAAEHIGAITGMQVRHADF